MIILPIPKVFHILIFVVIFFSLTQNIFGCLYKNDFSVLHANIWSIDKNFGAFKHFYSTLNCKFSEICFSETWATENLVCKVYNFQRENYAALHQIRDSGKGGELQTRPQSNF